MNKEMTVPPPLNQEGIDLTKIIEWLVGAMTFITLAWKLIDAYFASKRRDKQEFIEKVVKATMDSSLKDFKEDFKEFKQKTEMQMGKFNEIVFKLLDKDK